MTTLAEIQSAVTELSDEERAKLREWLEEYDADLWDKQIEEDFAAGRLDAILTKVDEDIKEGRIRPL
jgi:succinate dehydrogenase flavin-adding protein (antitoxin of CptAB toxin-antitoxin module)